MRSIRDTHSSCPGAASTSFAASEQDWMPGLAGHDSESYGKSGIGSVFTARTCSRMKM